MGLRWAVLILGAPLACNGEVTRECEDATSLRVCDGGDCQVQSCRGDQVCEAGDCVFWADATLSADFVCAVSDTNPNAVRCDVDAPEERVVVQRLTFGDDYSGWGNSVRHVYEEPGVYAVDLEVRLEGFRELRASRLVTIAPLPADWSPLSLTLNQIPTYLNGTVPYRSNNSTPGDPSDDYDGDFHLLVPRAGFTVDVELLDDAGAPIDPASLTLVADVDLPGAPAGTDLSGHLIRDEGEALRVPRWHWRVSESFPVGMVSLTLAADGASEVTLTFEVTELPAERDPFDRPLTWLLRFDMDDYSTSSVFHDNGAVEITSTPGADGVPDFRAELRACGAQGSESAPGAATVTAGGRVGANAIYRDWVQSAVIEEILSVFFIGADGTPHDGIALGMVASDAPGAPSPGEFSTAGAFSMMRFGGALDGAFGRSWFSEYNEDRVDDTDATMGVGSGTLLNALMTAPGVHEQLDGIKPNTGVPVGDDPLDAIILADDFDPWDLEVSEAAAARWQVLTRAARWIGIIIASVAAHEMGHAMGLMPNGPPPDGFFGNRGDVAFIGANFTNSHHTDFPPLNLMQAGGNPLEIVATALERVELPRGLDLAGLLTIFARENRMSPYTRAYLKRQLTYRAF